MHLGRKIDLYIVVKYVLWHDHLKENPHAKKNISNGRQVLA